ncbi:SMP-30/gluconolactonase/LRE family protein [Steroidobacter agaridevorans]|uniref:SMP-30/gluconolactonase/LRE family protein n=1 Tax=Steroidobacter agaridevorans TaxID=2695856 RepID=UPI001324C9BA|nr:SMP-30/gluconolactonase/LRE family protein [Steroidobacter agaridevorans]GFE86767.1 gluconolactonase [Steroidobacter agaridevorans]
MNKIRSWPLAGLLIALGAQADGLVTPAIEGVVAGGTPIVLIKEGFKGTEGPIALPDGSVAFTEGQINQITRIAPDNSISPYLENSGGANGLAFNAAGELIAVQTTKPGIAVLAPAAKQRVLVDQYEGKPLNRPNDLVVDQRGGVYFTDPGARPEPGQPAPQTAVYYLPPKGALKRLATDVGRPNGIQLSPDEKTLYVANTFGDHILAYDIQNDGSVGRRRNFAKLDGVTQTETGVTSGADGLAVDAKGRLYVASAAGVQVFDSKGAALGTIPLPKAPQNLAFAGEGKKTLYIVGRGAAYKIAVLTPGFAGRVK